MNPIVPTTITITVPKDLQPHEQKDLLNMIRRLAEHITGVEITEFNITGPNA